MKKLVLAILLTAGLLVPGFPQVSAQDEGYDQVAFTNGDAYLFAACVELEGETASSLFSYFKVSKVTGVIDTRRMASASPAGRPSRQRGG